MEVKIVKNEGALVPKKATKGAAAYDVYVPEDVVIKKGRQIVSLKLIMALPEGYEAKIEPRSGFSAKGMEGYHVVDQVVQPYTPGTVYITPGDGRMYWSDKADRFDADVIEGKIDSDYRGEIGVIIKSCDDRMFGLKRGTRIAQLTIYKVEDVEFKEFEKLSKTDRGDGGFGHTGSN